jgi:uncharacterized protein (DUF305 family)
MEAHMHHDHYIRLAAMAVLSFVAMYILMYAMVDEFGSVFNNINQAYMAALMAAPMVIIEIVVMSSMYRNRTANAAIIALSVVILAGSFYFIRQQTAVGDTQFLRSMIPHHSGAVLMCREAALTDERIKRLCHSIIDSQLSEIAQMKDMLGSTQKSAQGSWR